MGCWGELILCSGSDRCQELSLLGGHSWSLDLVLAWRLAPVDALQTSSYPVVGYAGL